MTLQLRRKRQITAAPKARATTNFAPTDGALIYNVPTNPVVTSSAPAPRRRVWLSAFLAAMAVAAGWTASKAHADGGPPPLFLAPHAAASEISSTDNSGVEQASRERLKERAAAVSNPNLNWKPYRPAPKPSAANEPTSKDATSKEAVSKRAASKSAVKSTVKSADAQPAAARRVRKSQPTADSRRASKIETAAESDVFADTEPARRTATRTSNSRFREEILQVDQREKVESFRDSSDSEPARRKVARTGRSASQSDILQVAQREKADPFNDSTDTSTDDRGPAPNGKGIVDPSAPRTMDPSEEPFLDETLPGPSEQGGGGYEASNAPAETLSCDNDKRECADALRHLKAITIDKININIAVNGHEGEQFPCECELSGTFTDRNWESTLFTWKASSLCHKPLYFEEVGLERYGHSLNPFWQPIFSGVHFFATIPILPYMMGVYPPNECQYVLGYYRPGDCAPYMVPPFPFSLRGAIVEAAVVMGGILIVH